MFASKRGEQITFDSRSELAIGILLEKYIEGFKLIPGETIQIPIGKHCYCDFRVKDRFFEYHPINIRHECGKEFARDVERSFLKLSLEQAYFAKLKLQEQLKKEYFDRRLYLIQTSFGKEAKLVVCVNPEEVWEYVFQKYAKGKVKLGVFREEFRAALFAEPLDEYSRRRFRI